MNQQQLQTFMNSLDFPLVTQITSGAGQIFKVLEFPEFVGAIYWICRNQNLLHEVKQQAKETQLNLF